MRVLVATIAVALLVAAPAAAHVGVKSYSPKRGATVSRSLERVKVTFDGRIADGKLTVRNAGGTKVSRREGAVIGKDRVLRARLKGGLARGRYTASMKVLHNDGHVTSKTWSFYLN